MGTQNYRDGIGKGRSEESGSDKAAVSRIAQRKAVQEQPKKTKSFLLTSLFFLFILIPVSILIYVAFFYEPNDVLTTSPSSNEVSMESTIPDAPLVPVIAEEENAEAEAEAAAAKEAAEKQAAEAASKKEAEKAAAEKEQAETKTAQAEAEKQDAQAAEQPEQEAPPAPVAASKTHTVQAGETLYRIAVNTYGGAGATEGVEKIKAANGLTSNEITAGSTLVLP